MARGHALAIAALLGGLAGCSNVLGLKDPTFQDTGKDAATDGAAIDAPADGAVDTGPAACAPSTCPFGCDPGTNACRPEKLWVYLTTGAFLGDGFGGKDAPPDVRTATDTLCFTTASQSFATRACSRDRSHAVLTINATDNIPAMATLYSIPTTVEVHRADDDVLVANTWNDLTDTTKAPRAAVASATSAATEAAGIVWTGVGGSSTCVNWTSEAATDSGVRGHTTLTSTNWMVRDSAACNLLERVLCVCWSGGQ